MILYAPYEARYEVVPVLKSFLNDNMPKVTKVSDEEFSALPENMKPLDIMPFMKSVNKNVRVDRNVRSGRDWLLRAVDAYSSGRELLQITKGDEEMARPVKTEVLGAATFFENPFHTALRSRPEEILSRMEGRIDVLCETKRASAICVHSAWQDLQAITHVFSLAMIGHDEDFSRVMEPIIRFVDAQTDRAANKISGLSAQRLVRGKDYLTP